MFDGLAATCETEQELQMYLPPPAAPAIMFLRMASETPPAWQFAASIGLLALCILAVLWFPARLCRIGILMYGKRATLPEILPWLRYS